MHSYPRPCRQLCLPSTPCVDHGGSTLLTQPSCATMTPCQVHLAQIGQTGQDVETLVRPVPCTVTPDRAVNSVSLLHQAGIMAEAHRPHSSCATMTPCQVHRAHDGTNRAGCGGTQDRRTRLVTQVWCFVTSPVLVPSLQSVQVPVQIHKLFSDPTQHVYPLL